MSWVFIALVSVVSQAQEYRIGTGDGLQVLVYNESNLHAEVVVSDRCEISLGLIGRVPACGVTAADLEERITKRYADGYLVNPSVSVKVTNHTNQRVDVLGEVEKRGPIFLERRATLIEVISMAGGPSGDNVVEVEVASSDGSRKSYEMSRLRSGEDVVHVQGGDRVTLKPGEVVFLEGEVKRPGTVVLRDGMTLTQALSLAGGLGEYANARRVFVKRKDGTRTRVNLGRIQRGQDEDFVLAADDYVVVQRGL